MAEVRLEVLGDFISLKPLRRSHVQASDYWDANWIETEIDILIKPWRGKYIANLRADEFQAFRVQLQEIYEKAAGRAEFKSMEPWLELTVELDSLGHVRLTGTADPEIGNVFGLARLTFEMEGLDQTSLPPLISQLEELERDFPVVGKP
jgi:hypothetical protein